MNNSKSNERVVVYKENKVMNISVIFLIILILYYFTTVWPVTKTTVFTVSNYQNLTWLRSMTSAYKTRVDYLISTISKINTFFLTIKNVGSWFYNYFIANFRDLFSSLIDIWHNIVNFFVGGN